MGCRDLPFLRLELPDNPFADPALGCGIEVCRQRIDRKKTTFADLKVSVENLLL